MQDSDSSDVQYTHTVKARIIHFTICADRMDWRKMTARKEPITVR